MKIDTFKHSKKVLIVMMAFFLAAIGGATLAYTTVLKKTIPAENGKVLLTASTDPSESPQKKEDMVSPDRVEITGNLSKVVLRVDGMSCSGCIYTIKSSLEPLKAVRDILVNLSAGEAEVYYDASALKDVLQIADAITASGYPATVSEIVSADQIKKERDLAAARSIYYIASVGQWMISRDDFNSEFNHAKSRYAQIYGERIFDSGRGKALMDNLKAQIVSRLINEGIQMQEIQSTGFAVDRQVVEVEFKKFLDRKKTQSDQFKTDLDRNGYAFEYFMKKFENQVLISKYLDDKILDGVTDGFEKRRRYESWFNNAKLLAKVVYYDKDIERLIQTRTAGGCSGGSSCSTAR